MQVYYHFPSINQVKGYLIAHHSHALGKKDLTWLAKTLGKERLSESQIEGYLFDAKENSAPPIPLESILQIARKE